MNTLVLTIGRALENDIIIPENFISSRHAQLLRDETGQWFINDLNSTNGVMVNGVRINNLTALKPTDFILLGGHLLSWPEIYHKYQENNNKTPKTSSNYLVNFFIALGAALILIIALVVVYEMSSGTVEIENNNTDNKQGEQITIKTVPANIKYDFSCVRFSEDTSIDHLANNFDSVHRELIKFTGVDVSLQEEVDFGTENHLSFLNGNRIFENSDAARLKTILAKLVQKIPDPRGFTYQVFLIDDEEINSWTCGGRIYFTTGMLKFTKKEDEIAGILGHEINHNELGHINSKLKAQKFIFKTLGNKRGEIAASVESVISKPFGKKDEVFCDLKGTDLLIASGYNPCEEIVLWNRMAEMEQKKGMIDEFIRSHPYSSDRAACIRNHLNSNYHTACNGNE